MLLYEALGEAIRQTRHEKQMKQRYVSARAKVALGYLSEIERGHKDLSSSVLESLANALEVSTHELVIRAGLTMAGLEIPDTIEWLDKTDGLLV